jgi:hypothetical protein
MRRFILLAVVLSAAIVTADTARFSVVVLDDKKASPIPNATVRANFSEDIGWRAWTESSKPYVVIEKTDKTGYCWIKGKTNCGRVACWIPQPPEGYYSGGGWGYRFKKKNFLGVWQPDNLVVTIKLQRVEHPIPLFIKNFFKDGNDYVEVDYFGKGAGKMQLDLIKGDWLPPLGNGEISDVVFTRLEREDLGIGTNFNGRTAAAYRDGISVKFLGIDNGLVEIPFEKTSGIMIRTAPEDGYKSDYLVTKGKDKKVKYFSSSNPDRNFAFRIRTKRDKDGRIISAYYGKIYGDIEIKKFSYGLKVPVATPAFLYYLNPTPLDRNLEWDMKTNLCPNPGSISKEP